MAIKHAIHSSLRTQNANHMSNRSGHSDKIAVQLTHRRLPQESTNRRSRYNSTSQIGTSVPGPGPDIKPLDGAFILTRSSSCVGNP